MVTEGGWSIWCKNCDNMTHATFIDTPEGFNLICDMCNNTAVIEYGRKEEA